VLFIFLLCLFPIYSRGLFELVFSNKKIAYFIQFIASSLLVLFIWLNSSINLREKSNRLFFLFFISFFFALIISSLLTYFRFSNLLEIAAFSAVILFLFFYFTFFNIIELKKKSLNFTPSLLSAFIIIGILLLTFGIIEMTVHVYYFKGGVPFFNLDQEGAIYMRVWSKLKQFYYTWPGKSFHWIGNICLNRPASLTGSYLHFPILMPLFGAVMLRFGNRWIKAIGILLLLLPFAAFSRSGILISGIIFLFLSFQAVLKIKEKMLLVYQKNVRNFILIIAGSLSAATLMIALLLFIPTIRLYFFGMIERIFNFNDVGNSARYGIWKNTLSVFFRSNLFFGEFTGMVTNIVHNLFVQSKLQSLNIFNIFVAESGLLEILVNFGVLGLFAFYGAFFYSVYRAMFIRKERLLGFALFGGVIQSFFYQSIEVLPFMVTMALVAFFANNSGMILGKGKDNENK
jgi:hypothetical protein